VRVGLKVLIRATSGSIRRPSAQRRLPEGCGASRLRCQQPGPSSSFLAALPGRTFFLSLAPGGWGIPCEDFAGHNTAREAAVAIASAVTEQSPAQKTAGRSLILHASKATRNRASSQMYWKVILGNDTAPAAPRRSSGQWRSTDRPPPPAGTDQSCALIHAARSMRTRNRQEFQPPSPVAPRS